MRCPNCSTEIPSGKKFCGFCGENLTGEPETALDPIKPDIADMSAEIPEVNTGSPKITQSTGSIHQDELQSHLGESLGGKEKEERLSISAAGLLLFSR